MGWNQGLFQSLLYEKYKQQQQQTDADTKRADAFGLTSQAQANLDNARAGLIPQGAEAAKARESDLAHQQAETQSILENTKYIGPLARSQIGLQGSESRNYVANAGQTDAETFRQRLIWHRMGAFQDELRKAGLDSGYGDSGYGGSGL